jgi:ABC-type uncharacterized transport system substrate-binding protein
MRRRAFLAWLCGATALPLAGLPPAARAQQRDRVRRIGWLSPGSSPGAAARGFFQALREHGYVEGQNLVVEYRWAGGNSERLTELAADLVSAGVDLIVTAGTPATLAAKQATSSIPIVFAAAGAPVEKGLVASLANPGGNVTGLALITDDLKPLQILKEAAPAITRVIMVFSNLALALLKPIAGNVPIVFVGVGDPVGDGFVASLARPGGNITGFAGTDGPIGSKWVETLKESSPHLTHVMMILHPETPIHQAFWRSAEAAAPRFGVEVTPGGVHDAAGIERAISSFAMQANRGVIVAPHAITWANEELIVALTLRHRLPTHFATAASVMAGGLVSYGHDFEDSFRKTAEYVDRILRGEKPDDLPVQMPTKFRLVFNMRTAKALGLEIPPSLLARADEVIE